MAGPPGNISGRIFFATGMTPSRLAVYAVRYGSSEYVMTEVDPPARTYELRVPPGGYAVVARLDSDPLSAAGHLECGSSRCGPLMTRAGAMACASIDCQPYLTQVLVTPGQNVDNIDLGGWGSLRALDQLWSIDVDGTPILGVATSPSPRQLPARALPPAAPIALPSEFVVRSSFEPSYVLARLRLPADWHAIANPARAVNDAPDDNFSNRDVRSPLALPADGIWLTLDFASIAPCARPRTQYATAQAGFDRTTLFFEDPHSAAGVQPFSGYSLVTVKPANPCLFMRFSASSSDVLESALPTILAIVQQAE